VDFDNPIQAFWFPWFHKIIWLSNILSLMNIIPDIVHTKLDMYL